MTGEPTVACPSCGAQASGKFCSACGGALESRPCRQCGAACSPTARFCRACGAPTAASAAGSARAAWTVAGLALTAFLVTLLLFLRRGEPASVQPQGLAPAGAAEPAGTPPDISAMSPRERFDRLYNRIMRAAESGDEGTVTQFTPMALMAYAQLDTLDADARYHAALLKVHTGDVDGALALADTVLADSPGHLFGYIIRGTVARWRKDDKTLSQAYAGFLKHYDAEMKADRPEYREHQPALEEFRRQAQAAGS